MKKRFFAIAMVLVLALGFSATVFGENDLPMIRPTPTPRSIELPFEIEQ